MDISPDCASDFIDSSERSTGGGQTGETPQQPPQTTLGGRKFNNGTPPPQQPSPASHGAHVAPNPGLLRPATQLVPQQQYGVQPQQQPLQPQLVQPQQTIVQQPQYVQQSPAPVQPQHFVQPGFPNAVQQQPVLPSNPAPARGGQHASTMLPQQHAHVQSENALQTLAKMVHEQKRTVELQGHALQRHNQVFQHLIATMSQTNAPQNLQQAKQSPPQSPQPQNFPQPPPPTSPATPRFASTPQSGKTSNRSSRQTSPKPALPSQ